jgi:nucleotide-binding universal stress UspA family protein
MQYH